MTATVDTLVDHVRLCSTCRPAFSFDSMSSTGQTIRVGLEMDDRLRTRNVNGLRANYLVTLQLVIENDPEIPHLCGASCNCNLTEWERDILAQS
jgi:hypothetical protein